MRHGAVRRIGFVLADDAEGLTPTIVAHDGHGRAEMHLAAIIWRWDDLCACPPRGPITQVASHARKRGAVVGRMRRCVLLLKACDFGLDAREPLGGYQVRMR